MMRVQLGLSILGFFGLLACGGRTIDESGSGDPEPSAPAPTSTANGGAGKTSSADPFPSQKLGVCKPGFDRARNPARACHWLTDSGICFETTESACACICPTDKDSVCAHGFDGGPSSAVPIYCL